MAGYSYKLDSKKEVDALGEALTILDYLLLIFDCFPIFWIFRLGKELFI